MELQIDTSLSDSLELAFKSVGDTVPTDKTEQVLSFGHQFFKTWFMAEPSRAYLFIFKKNYKVTNLQYAELLSLLRVHARPASAAFDPVETLHFVSTDDFRSMVQRMWEAFDLTDDTVRREVAQLYAAVFQQTVAVERRFGCCEVYAPPGLNIDLRSMCAASGYIDSCGYNIFVRKAYKTADKKFVQQLIDYGKLSGKEKSAKVYFAAYSHEDFDEYDTEERRVLRDGLDDLKIALEKFYMGPRRIVDVLKAIKEEKDHPLEVARAGGSGRKQKTEIDQVENIDPERTLWLFVDRAVSARHDKVQTAEDLREVRQPGETTYFMCCDQRYVNENPYHIFDENKPGWEDHTTIPHTLMGAMINLTRPWWPRGQREVVICDPFVGSGTTLFEAAKFKRVRAIGRDRSALSMMIYRDNYEFFNATPEGLEVWKQLLNNEQEGAHRLYSSAIETIRSRSAGEEYSPEIVAAILPEEPDFNMRLILVCPIFCTSSRVSVAQRA